MPPFPVLAEMAIPSALQCFLVLGPVVAFILGLWLVRNVDWLIERILPNLKWQRELGWLNIRAERQASAFLRGVAYFIYALLALALYGIAWGAESLREIGHWNEPVTMGELATRLPVLAISIGLWLLYFGSDLIPRLRREYEQEELEQFRAEQAALEEAGNESESRFTTPQIWTKSPLPQRNRRGR